MELLGIPFKRTFQFNLGEKLSELIDSTFYQTSDTFRIDLNEISQLRDDVASNTNISLSQLELLYKYYSVLIQLQKKFPDDQISFAWCQTLSTKSNTKELKSLEWEISNVIYTLGSMYSLLARGIDISLDNLNTKYKYYQTAATLFHDVSQQNQHTAAVDKDTADALWHLMLAQGMECFWLKAMKKENIKDSMLAKLSSQVRVFYDKTLFSANRSPLINSHWIDHIKGKIKYFEAVTYYRMSLVLQEAQKWGEMVRILSHCVDLLSTCNLDTAKQFIEIVRVLLKDTAKDNDFIYLQVVPETVPQMVKPINMIELLDFYKVMNDGIQQWSGIRYFKTLLPLELIDTCNAYSERQTQYVMERIIQPIQTLNKQLEDKRTNVENSRNLTVVLIEMKDITSLEASLNNLISVYESINSKLSLMKQTLEDEAESDATLRATHGSLRWTLPVSNEVNCELYSKLSQIKEYLEQGHKTDNETREVLDMIDRDLLTTNENDYLKTSMSKKNEDPLMKEIGDVEKSRDIFLMKTREKMTTNTVLLKMIKAYRSNGEVVDQSKLETQFQEHLTIFQKDLSRVYEEKQINEKLFEQLEIYSTRSKSEGSMKRLTAKDLYNEEFNYSMGLLRQVRESINNGTQFYNDLVTSTNMLLAETEQFSDERKVAKRTLDTQLLTI
ncbi:similar to Saccharomyces cerevisiae YOR275C RIM20 Protein involved in proteolytic activation of Rim101p in response to alkaline pH [Maudiozyma barnettii]|uniref:Similar to Saccharomyces cerevisiae YOR275C RIM20 Protein involved in proteolytic activation of Rim101p in response to alkaline pH n=1 Tax=Maudiozyma barnettii TaxID=61262 RepID=A0A8H2VCW8_9SACH|nr:Rim20p [Kazachstania barnettii]CAB4252908.1 similar to Saccharomyces cerevisiae YOR275C RIM20 Protein involved in proteolytic activation of Rim101p in response to alkaline pH [Kazachstania barnettii]CAD1780703.1 similar to Saccharomyces cerevisiae YOR275C RIM20 Protein involved in proteolytic activation of Rim101p in response to alkaline pH [Kazachstania barnettii]